MKFSIKRAVFLVLALSLVAGAPLVTARPAMGSTPAPQTIVLPSGNTTQTAGYTYNNPYYQSVTYVSGTATQTAGYTFTDPAAAPLNVASYGGSWSPRVLSPTPTVHGRLSAGPAGSQRRRPTPAWKMLMKVMPGGFSAPVLILPTSTR